MKIQLTFFSLFLSFWLVGQSFSGSIEFKYTTQTDTNMNVYLVKNKKVRLDRYSKKDHAVEGSFLFDLEKGEIKWLNPKRKLWGSQVSETPQVIRGTCVVSKGTGYKTIAGIKCTEYIVKNAAENTVITYWIADGKYTFFTPLVKMWNRKDKQSIYFSQIKGISEGSMPLLSEERQLTDGKLQTRLEVIKITNSAPEDASLEVPATYSKM